MDGLVDAHFLMELLNLQRVGVHTQNDQRRVPRQDLEHRKGEDGHQEQGDEKARHFSDVIGHTRSVPFPALLQAEGARRSAGPGAPLVPCARFFVASRRSHPVGGGRFHHFRGESQPS